MPPRKDRQAALPATTTHTASAYSGSQSDEAIEQQLWHKVRAQLRMLEQLRPTAERTLRELDRLQAQVANATAQAVKDAAVAKGLSPDLVGAEERYKDNERILTLCEEAAATAAVEEGAIDSAIEQLSILIALTSAPPDHNDSKRKKRRIDASPPRGSLSPTLRGTPLPGSRSNTPIPLGHTSSTDSAASAGRLTSISGNAGQGGAVLDSSALFTSSRLGAQASTTTAQAETKGRKGSGASAGGVKGRRATGSSSGTVHDLRGSSPISSFGGGSASTSGGGAAASGQGTTAAAGALTPGLDSLAGDRDYVDPARARREVLAHQLPLRKGRRVAFRQPTKRNPGPGGQQPVVTEGEDGETWIMATVEECINNDRNRYVVRDLEDEGQSVAATWNTTLKAIVPLPESVATLPPHDYPPGSQVMALYPDTTCFYRATVVSGGPALQKLTPAKAAKKEQELLQTPYKLIFEDDGDDVKSVPAFLVVERP